jgi:hypothetical protein
MSQQDRESRQARLLTDAADVVRLHEPAGWEVTADALTRLAAGLSGQAAVPAVTAAQARAAGLITPYQIWIAEATGETGRGWVTAVEELMRGTAGGTLDGLGGRGRFDALARESWRALKTMPPSELAATLRLAQASHPGAAG